MPDINGQLITEKSLQKQTPTLFLFFDSGCELCHEELKQINENREQLQKGQIVFFSTETTEKIQDFLNSIAFHRQPNQFFLVDTNEELVKTMEIKGTPTAIIYDKDGKQIKRFNGPITVETLLKYLFE
ncbi:hypothetical protein FACS1894145_8280 [Bacteroidia bacterium]|nr:hypothetical protein FACS1894145_8280 [Bacteroidia bacterium]